MIQLALRSSIQADPPFGSAEVGQDRRQGDRRDHQLEAGQEDADPDDGEQHVRRAAVHAGECSLAGASRPGRCRRAPASGGPVEDDPVEPAVDRHPPVAADEVSVGGANGARDDHGHAVAPLLRRAGARPVGSEAAS